MAKKSKSAAKPRVEKVEVGKSGFSFPGFRETGFCDTLTHFVICGIIAVASEKIRMEFLLAKNAVKFGSYLLAGIYKKVDGAWVKIWAFKDQNFSGFGFLAMACGKPVIVFVSNNKVVETRPLADILSDADTRDPAKTARCKYEAAQWLRQYAFPNVQSKLGMAYTKEENEADEEYRRNSARGKEVENNVKKYSVGLRAKPKKAA